MSEDAGSKINLGVPGLSIVEIPLHVLATLRADLDEAMKIVRHVAGLYPGWYVTHDMIQRAKTLVERRKVAHVE
jgi:hypothetical protein